MLESSSSEATTASRAGTLAADEITPIVAVAFDQPTIFSASGLAACPAATDTEPGQGSQKPAMPRPARELARMPIPRNAVFVPAVAKGEIVPVMFTPNPLASTTVCRAEAVVKYSVTAPPTLKPVRFAALVEEANRFATRLCR